MKIFDHIIKRDFKNLALAIGCFDGIHKGHKKVIERAVYYKNLGLIPAVFTFSENPKSILFNSNQKKILSIGKKYDLLEKLGVEEVYNIDFNSIKLYLAEDFFKEVLVNTLGTKCIICGFNFRFGVNSEAGTKELTDLCSIYNIKSEVIPPVKYKGMAISSTRIRKDIELGNITDASNMLGRIYEVLLEDHF